MQIDFDEKIVLISKEELGFLEDIVKIVATERIKLGKTLQGKDQCGPAIQLIQQVQGSLQQNSVEDLIQKCSKLSKVENLKDRLNKGANFAQIMNNLSSQSNQIQATLNQILMADADNVRKY